MRRWAACMAATSSRVPGISQIVYQWSAYGYCASHSRYFWGLRLYLCCAPDGMRVSFCLAPANEPEREVAAAMLENARRDGLLTGREIIVGDKGFSGREFEEIVASLDATSSVPTARTSLSASATSAASANG